MNSVAIVTGGANGNGRAKLVCLVNNAAITGTPKLAHEASEEELTKSFP